MQETKALPKIALTAYAQLNAAVQQEVGRLHEQALEALGIAPTDGWKIDITNGIAVREVPDIEPAKE